MLNKSNPFSYMKNNNKIQKNNLCRILNLFLRSGSFAMGQKNLQQFFLKNLYLINSFSSGIVRINKLHNCVEGICFLNNGCYRMGKRRYFSYHSKIAKTIKYFVKNMFLIYSNYHQ